MTRRYLGGLASDPPSCGLPVHDWSESPEVVASFRKALLDFFDRAARALPWRSTRDPYRILVSEIMAQQTRVETVVPYYERWLARFPTIDALAAAPQDDVLKMWEGLGYYSRARNLHRAAGVVCEAHGGLLPRSAVELKTLPGVGPYTAGAVASIAFDEAVPAVDGNVRRVFARLFDEPTPAAAAVGRWAAGVVDPDRPGDFNQSLMELGATVCTPRGARCDLCPVGEWCGARAAGTVDERPLPKKRARVRRETRAVAVVVAGGEESSQGASVLLRRRPAEGLLAGLWEFPSVATSVGDAPAEVEGAVEGLGREAAGSRVSVGPGVKIDPVRHLFSHLHVTYQPFLYRVRAGPHLVGDGAHVAWVDLADLGGLAVPVAQQKIAELARRFVSSPKGG